MKNKNEHQEHQKILFAWQTPEFIPLPRGKMWYIVALLIMSGFIAYAVFTGSITMAAAFLMVGIVFMIIENRPPRTVDVEITNMGIRYDGVFYPYHHINAFWIVYHPPFVRAMYLRVSRGKTFRTLKIELNGENPVTVRKLLIKEVPEIEGAGEPFTDLLTRILRLQ
jgi:hypothetical protein